AWKLYLDRRSILLTFLHSQLSLHFLRRHRRRVELLQQSSFYIEILPKHLALGDQSHPMHPINLFQQVDPWRFQRMKKVGATQTQIQLLLLGDLLEQLERGREELLGRLKSCDADTFLSQWDRVKQRISELSKMIDSFLGALVPGKLHLKHRLVPDARAPKIPRIRLVLSARMPVLFDRKESAARGTGAALKWCSPSPRATQEQFEVSFRLLEPGAPERGHCGTLSVAATACHVQNLLPGRAYEFSVRRAETYALVYEQWRDSITLRTAPGPSRPAATGPC
ncbi:FND11 protein, partial [Crypturellus undulatus]|nr:FND11 protein [Crypturellus undulatus]